jgi:hypothetical protein
MVRLSVVVALVAVVAVVLVVAGRPGPGAVAQDATAGHPVVGSWFLTDPAFPDDPPSLAVFHADGVYLQADTDGTVGVGSWDATGERSLAVTFVQQFGDETGVFTVTIRAAGEVDAGGDTFTATYTIELTQPDGTSTGEYGPGTVTAERIAVEPMGTPVGPLEDLFGQFEEDVEDVEGATPDVAGAAVAISAVDEAGAPLPGGCYALTGAMAYAPVCDGDEYDADPTPGVVLIVAVEAGAYVVQEATPPAGFEAAAEATVELAAGQVVEVTLVHGVAPGATPSA